MTCFPARQEQSPSEAAETQTEWVLREPRGLEDTTAYFSYVFLLHYINTDPNNSSGRT